MDGLDALERELARDLELMTYPRREWLAPRRTRAGAPILDVLVVGAGQGGLAAAAALLRERIANILVVDDHPLDRAGPWLNFARMVTLRTPKHLTGPDLCIPNLTIQRWYEAQHGAGAWERLGLVPKETWAEYLAWYRRVLGIPVRAETNVELVRPADEEACLAAEVVHAGRRDTIFARRIVLATGIDGSGAWDVPASIRDVIPRAQWAHTRDDIDFPALAGKRVGVLGAGASAFDNAAVALEHGAASVDLFFRRPRLVDVNAYRWAEFVGFLKHMGDVPDPMKWRFVRQILRMGQLPPADTLRRASEHPAFTLRPSSPWQRIAMRGDTIVVTTPHGEHELDFVIVGTGFVTDLSLRPELAELHEHIALWRDRYTPPDDERHDDLSRHPYLGPSFEFLPKEPGEHDWVSHVHNYTFGCLLSLGFGGASISGMKYSLPRLVGGLTRSLFVEDREAHYAALCGWNVTEF
jgi:cation diffusion facilitator CzcD-associated flavoprotein CzcO